METTDEERLTEEVRKEKISGGKVEEPGINTLYTDVQVGFSLTGSEK